MPKNNRKVRNTLIRLSGLLAFLITVSNFYLLANDLPIKVDCENQVCDCYQLQDYTKSLDFDKIIKSINDGQITDSILIACCYHQIALDYYENYDELSSLKYNKRAKEIREKHDDGLLWRSHLNIGFNYYELNEYKLASSYFKKALILPGEKDAYDSLTIFKNLAEYYLEIGDFETAINFAEQSILFNVDQRDKNSALNIYVSILINSQNNINLIKAKKIGKKAFELSKAIQDYDNMKLALNNLANLYLNIDSLDNAIALYKDAIELSVKNDTINEIKLLNNLANAFFDKKEVKLAISALNDSYSLLSKYYNTDYNYEYAAYYENLADICTDLKQLDTALQHYQKALINLTNNFRTEDIFQNPNPKNVSLFIYSNPDIIRVLQLKAKAAFKYYQQNKNKKHLTLANQTYQTAFNFHDKLQKDISTENSRLFQAKNIVPYIENALETAYQQQKNGEDISQAAFRFMEKNKATVLLQSMNEADALQYANLPDSLLAREKDLKIAITYHKKQLNEAVEYEDTLEMERLDKLLFDEKQQYSQLIKSLENNHPAYYQLKYQQNQTRLTDVQNQLTENTALLEYFIGDSSIYVLAVQQQQSKLYKIKKPNNWKDTIKNLRNAVNLSNKDDRANPYTKKLYQQFLESAHSLFLWLLKEPLAELGEKNHHLKIIPDAALNYIPFDVLLTDMADTAIVNYKTLPYLIKEKSISYNYSAALMMEQKRQNQSKKDVSFGGYAPVYSKEDSVDADLPKTRLWVTEMEKFFNGKTYLNETATKANFLKDTLSYNLLLLAMHGKLDDEQPLNSHLVFTKTGDFKLQAADLYNHKLNTDLTVLSACQTGTGVLQKGEGVMSLSRAFTYAGSPSLIMSLWSIPEKSTAKLLPNFLKKLKNNTPKDVALQQAKLTYLENASATLAHPNYWAGLVLSGNESTINFGSKNMQNYLLFGLIFLSLISGVLLKAKF